MQLEFGILTKCNKIEMDFSEVAKDDSSFDVVTPKS